MGYGLRIDLVGGMVLTDHVAGASAAFPLAERLMQGFQHPIAGLILRIQVLELSSVQITLFTRHIQMMLRLPNLTHGAIHGFYVDIRMPATPSFGNNGRGGVR